MAMKINVKLVSILFILPLFFLSSCNQSTEEKIDNFSGMRWGVSSAIVSTRYRKMDFQSKDERVIFPERTYSGVEKKFFGININGDTMDVSFIFHPSKGLVKGYRVINFGDGKDCVLTYKKYRNQIIEKYTLTEEELIRKGKQNNLDLPFCSSVLVGQAFWWHRWKDKHGNQATMILGGERSKRNVTVLVESHDFIQWKQREGIYDYFVKELIQLWNKIF